MTPSCVGKCLRLTFSSDLEEAMFETGKSLSAISKFNSVIEKNQPIYRVGFVLAAVAVFVVDLEEGLVIKWAFFLLTELVLIVDATHTIVS